MKPVYLVVYLTGSAATAVAALTVAVMKVPPRRPEMAPPPIAVIPEFAEPIAAEALVFRGAGRMALQPDSRRERSAHPRTIATFRFLREYPGAPPRIPHGLSQEEFRTGSCGPCHERGGYSIRFAAYTPVTPHPELKQCLDCHAADDAVAGWTAPGDDPNTRCPQCHGAEGRVRPGEAPSGASLWWQPSSRPSEGPPPVIPHQRFLREDCLACHAGPAAVREIRTTHPNEEGCRTCHLEVDPDAEPFHRSTVPPERATP